MATNPEDGALVLCGARSKRNNGAKCGQPAMANGKCRLHGGKSTGPRTKQGRKRCGMSNWRHGLCSEKARAEHREIKELIEQSKKTLEGVF